MLSKEDVKKIKEMSEFIEHEQIAKVYEVPLSVVEDVLKGNLTGDNEGNTDNVNVKVVEKPKFVRNKTICTVSAGGGTGSTSTLSSLAIYTALNIPGGRNVGILDLAEYNNILSFLGIETEDSVLLPGIIYCSENPDYDEIFKQLSLAHPHLENLHIIPGSIVLDQQMKINSEIVLKILSAMQKHFEVIFIDMPHRLDIINEVLPYADSALVMCRDDYTGIDNVAKLYPTLRRLNKEEQSMLIVNKTSSSNTKSGTFQKILSNMVGRDMSVTSFLPFENKLPEWQTGVANQHPVLDISDYSMEIKKLVSILFPHWNIQNEKKKGFVKSIIDNLKSN